MHKGHNELNSRQDVVARGDTILAVKGNQKILEQGIEDSFRFLKVADFNETLDFGHGRVETRKCSVITNLEHIENKADWVDIKSIIKIELANKLISF